MELYAKGQLSYLILTCLQERDFYGLDIISEISNRSNGKINLKKPSVYSNLTRMETQGYISAYLQSSDFGPNRKYYSLTEKGRNFYKELKEYFDRNNVDVFRGLIDQDQTPSTFEDLTDITPPSFPETQEIISTNEDFFDFSSIDSPVNEDNQTKIENNHEQEEVKAPDEAQSKSEDYQFIPATASLKEEVKFVQNENSDETSIEEYNRRLYDISKDINKYKRKRSFAEDQIEMTATMPLTDSEEKTRSSIEEFKSSFLENKNKYQHEQITNLDFSRYMNSNRTYIKEEVKPKELENEEQKNDAVFITKRYDESTFEKPKKIEPPRLKIELIEANKETKLPAPKRDLTIDPSHKEILTKLYSKSRDSSNEEVREDALYDFDDLKKYYQKQNIAFTEYKKPADKVEHNTNKLYLWLSIISLVLSATFSGILYLTLFKTNLCNPKTNFMYILVPSLFILDVLWKFYNFKKYKGWLPSQMKPQWQIWGLFFLISGFTVGLNFICGMNNSNFVLYATTTILPILIAFINLPLRYYIKRLILVKYWK